MKINRAFIKGTNWALAGLISMLGFTGCIKENELEYGVPNADYTVKGTVVDKATGKPIKGIQVVLTAPYTYTGIVPMYGIMPTPYSKKDSVITNTNGEFKITENLITDPSLKTLVYAEDIDGEQNGLYKSDTLQVDFSNAEKTKKSKNWYDGEFTVTVDVKLEEIKNQ